MIYGFPGLARTLISGFHLLIYGFYIPEYLKKIRKHEETCSNILFRKSGGLEMWESLCTKLFEILEVRNLECCEHDRNLKV